jgi:hypothetical protein
LDLEDLLNQNQQGQEDLLMPSHQRLEGLEVLEGLEDLV